MAARKMTPNVCKWRLRIVIMTSHNCCTGWANYAAAHSLGQVLKCVSGINSLNERQKGLVILDHRESRPNILSWQNLLEVGPSGIVRVITNQIAPGGSPTRVPA